MIKYRNEGCNYFRLFREREWRDAAVIETSDGIYKDGDAVKTALPRTTVPDNYYSGDNFRLTLPIRMTSGKLHVHAHFVLKCKVRAYLY